MIATLLIATHNRGKLREFAHIFSDLPLRLVDLSDIGIAWEADETGATFEANARQKAEAYCAFTRLPTLAEDSGLEVSALGGAPGVLSARYGGPGLDDRARYEMLLREMRGVPAGKRGARYVSVIAIARPGSPTRIAEGACPGEILATPRGSGGFGYDPVFYLPELACTMAELSLEDKNRISHRARSSLAARALLRDLLTSDPSRST
jgi:XTP/dITP diphosphohydrolase